MKCLIVSALFLACLTTGCSSHREAVGKNSAFTPEHISARYTDTPVVIDGHLDDPVWQKAERYPLLIGEDRGAGLPEEEAEIMLAWDENTLYVGARLYDSDIHQKSEDDQTHLYRTGDVLEVFLKPEIHEWYWELYGAPNNTKTVFWLPARKFLGVLRHFDQWTEHMMDLEVAAHVEGRLNDKETRDDYWTIEMAIPANHLARWYLTSPFEDLYFGPGSEWRILVARYNHSRFLDSTEFSMLPQMPITNFHAHEKYGLIRFER